MQKFFDSFGKSVKQKRLEMHLTQTQLAARLGMCNRTIIQLENGKGNAKFETLILVAKELNVSIDASVFADSSPKQLSKCVSDFFFGKSEAEAQYFVDICKQAEKWKELPREIPDPCEEE